MRMAAEQPRTRLVFLPLPPFPLGWCDACVLVSSCVDASAVRGCGRLTAVAPPVRPPLVANPLGGSAKPQYGISKNLI